MNNNRSLGWTPLLQSDAPAACSLVAALFTSYDRADERLLVESLLPELLKLNHEPDGDAAERSYFLLELDDRLKGLHDRIVVVSSTLRESSNDEETPDCRQDQQSGATRQTLVAPLGTPGWQSIP